MNVQVKLLTRRERMVRGEEIERCRRKRRRESYNEGIDGHQYELNTPLSQMIVSGPPLTSI